MIPQAVAILSRYALPLMGAALLVSFTAWGVQTWRIGSLQADNGRLEGQLDAALAANQTNQRTIDAMEREQERNAARYREAIERGEQAADTITQLERELSERADDDISAIESTDDDCARKPIPPDIRLRLDPSRDGNAGSTGSGGAPGPG